MSEADHRDGRRLLEAQIGRFQRGGAFRHNREFSNRPCAKIEEAGEDSIAWLEAGHIATHLGHDAGQIAAQGGWQLEMQYWLEHPRWNHVVDRIQAGSVDVHQ